MHSLYTATIFNFLSNHKYQNLHTRKTKQVNKKRVLKHLHGMKWENKDLILGYFCGPIEGSIISEIQYGLDSAGVITVTISQGIDKKEALDYINKEFPRIKNRTIEKQGGFYPKYSKGSFYLRRSSSQKITTSGEKAIRLQHLTSNFVKTMASWNLCIIEGNN